MMNQKKLDDFIDTALSNKEFNASLNIREVTQAEREEVLRQGGPDIGGMQHILEAKELRHAFKRHSDSGETSRQPSQRPLSLDDLKRILEVLDTFDELTVQPRTNNRTSIIYGKYFEDGKIEYVERVIETSHKHKPRLVTKTVWVKATTGVESSLTRVYTPYRGLILSFSESFVNFEGVSAPQDGDDKRMVGQQLTGPSLLSADNLSYAYDSGHAVLCKVSVEVQAGSVTGIVGPNGSGKSTLMRLMAGQVPLQSGSIKLKDTPLESLPPKDRGRIMAYLPQMVQPVFDLTVRDVVALGRYPYATLWDAPSRSNDDKVIARCLEMTQCVELQGRSFDTLSGGERQRALLASVLAQEPELLLLDEPTAALDLHHQEEAFAILRRLAAESNYGVVVITHDLNLAGRYCDQLLLLNRNHSTAAYGTPQKVLQQDILSEAYGANIQVAVNPFTGTPLIHPSTSEPRS